MVVGFEAEMWDQGSAISRVFEMALQNIKNATMQQASLEVQGASQFQLLKQKKQCDVFDVKVVEFVVEWWNIKIQVNPCRKDTIRDWLSTNKYITHLMHLLQETLESSCFI